LLRLFLIKEASGGIYSISFEIGDPGARVPEKYGPQPLLGISNLDRKNAPCFRIGLRSGEMVE